MTSIFDIPLTHKKTRVITRKIIKAEHKPKAVDYNDWFLSLTRKQRGAINKARAEKVATDAKLYAACRKTKFTWHRDPKRNWE